MTSSEFWYEGKPVAHTSQNCLAAQERQMPEIDSYFGGQVFTEQELADIRLRSFAGRIPNDAVLWKVVRDAKVIAQRGLTVPYSLTAASIGPHLTTL